MSERKDMPHERDSEWDLLSAVARSGATPAPVTPSSYPPPTFGYEVLQSVFLLATFGLGYFACRLFGFPYGTAEHTRIIFSIFTGFNVAAVYVARQGLLQIPPRSMLRDSLTNVLIALGCAACANVSDLAIWLTGFGMLKTSIVPNLFFVSALVFGIAGVFQLARVCRVSPGIGSAVTFIGIIVLYSGIAFYIAPNIFSGGPVISIKKEVIFGLLYSFVIGYMTAVTLKIWRDAQGTLRTAARQICFGTVLLSVGCAIYGPLFAGHTPLEVASHPVHVLLSLGYFIVGLGVHRMGMTVLSVFSPEIEPLAVEKPLVVIFGPVLGLRVYETMAKKIRETHEAVVRLETESKLRKEYILELEREIQRSTQAEEALKAAKDAAETAVISKSHFLSLITHELRTPLSAILAYGQMLGDTTGPMSRFTGPEVRELGTRIQKSAAHLQNLIDGILQFSKLENGISSPDLKHFMLQELLDFIIPLAEAQARERKLRFAIEAPDTPVSLFTDQQHLRQIVVNVLLNAFKFTREGTVTLRVTTNDRALRVSIADTGIGIPAESIGNVFEPFYQVSSGITRKYGGTGIGLPIVKQLVTVMKGEISISSRVDQGTRVDIVLPDIVLTATPAPDVSSGCIVGTVDTREGSDES